MSAPPASKRHVHDVLIIGGGPAGSSCAYWLAEAGWDVVVVERKRFPRDKTCGDGLTPRSVRQLQDMGLEADLAGAHRYRGLRSCGFGQVLELRWPSHPAFCDYAYTITRLDLDGLVAERAVKAGATLLQRTEAVAPIAYDGTPVNGDAGAVEVAGGRALPACGGALVEDGNGTRPLFARYVVVADGANSRFGRALGTGRNRTFPLGMALRGYYRSPRHDDEYIESHLDIRTRDGAVIPGYGWIFPLGDGRVNVGVGLLTVERRWKGANTTRLMEAFVAGAPPSWGISEETSCGPPTGGKLPMGLCIRPLLGSNTLVVGDAAGAINPFNGEGIAYGYETGRLAAAALGAALSGEGVDALHRYVEQVERSYGPYYRVARAFVRLISDPTRMRVCVSTGMRSQLFMAELLRIMANLMRPDTTGAAEAGYRAMKVAARLWPEAALSAS